MTAPSSAVIAGRVEQNVIRNWNQNPILIRAGLPIDCASGGTQEIATLVEDLASDGLSFFPEDIGELASVFSKLPSNTCGMTEAPPEPVDEFPTWDPPTIELPPTIGIATLCLTRPVPVLSEAAAVMAGAGGLPLRQFLLATGLANLGIAVCYAILGAAAQDAGGFLLVFAASLTVPVAGYCLYWLGLRLRRGDDQRSV